MQSDGHCFRLYTENAFFEMPQRTEPEIKRVSLTFASLHLLAAGQENVWNFHFMDQPDRDARELLPFILFTRVLSPFVGTELNPPCEKSCTRW